MKKTWKDAGLDGLTFSRIARPAATMAFPCRATQNTGNRRWSSLEWFTTWPRADMPDTGSFSRWTFLTSTRERSR